MQVFNKFVISYYDIYYCYLKVETDGEAGSIHIFSYISYVHISSYFDNCIRKGKF